MVAVSLKNVIQVKENEHLSAQTGGRAQETEGTDLAATQDCTILSIVTRQGTPLVHEGDQVKKGDLLISVDLEAVKAAGYDVITPMVVCNTSDYQTVEAVTGSDVNPGDTVLILKK